MGFWGLKGGKGGGGGFPASAYVVINFCGTAIALVRKKMCLLNYSEAALVFLCSVHGAR